MRKFNLEISDLIPGQMAVCDNGTIVIALNNGDDSKEKDKVVNVGNGIGFYGTDRKFRELDKIEKKAISSLFNLIVEREEY